VSEFTCQHGMQVRMPSQYSIDQCRACWINAGGDYRAPVVPFEIPCYIILPYADWPTLPCIYRGDKLTIAEMMEADLPINREWYPCAKGYGRTRQGIVCSCEGCGPLCPGYAMDTEHG
jgi:hypothetical protein